MAKKHWIIYIIRNRYDKLYTGITTDITRRFQQHQLGKGAKALKGKAPLLLVYQSKLENHAEAL